MPGIETCLKNPSLPEMNGIEDGFCVVDLREQHAPRLRFDLHVLAPPGRKPLADLVLQGAFIGVKLRLGRKTRIVSQFRLPNQRCNRADLKVVKLYGHVPIEARHHGRCVLAPFVGRFIHRRGRTVVGHVGEELGSGLDGGRVDVTADTVSAGAVGCEHRQRAGVGPGHVVRLVTARLERRTAASPDKRHQAAHGVKVQLGDFICVKLASRRCSRDRSHNEARGEGP